MNIDKLWGRRGYVIRRLTRMSTFVEDVMTKKIRPEDEDILLRLDKVDAFQDFIEDATEEDKFESQYAEVKVLLMRWQELLKPRQTTSENVNTGASALERMLQQQAEILLQISNQSTNERLSTSNSSSHVRLPVINLPNFDGKIENWKRFSDTFRTLIHESELPNVQKHQYLISALSGVAAKITIEISVTNCEVAWKLLNDRFDNDKTICKRHIQCLFEIPQVDVESSTGIQNLIDHIQNIQKHLRVLKRIKLPTDKWDDLLLYMIEENIDKLTRRHWEEFLEGKEEVSVDIMIDFLQRRCQLLDRRASSSGFIT
ncbi:uncharacterized protein LOC127284055 [Leptopilina boulardi]|uniref:uncharacterized protein LOC127284055 n=1 Tax=Leptopilina boulardi TaxID=63433 RepID=UPI0021F688C1|nr:uncharacterized protein LOC127284055 [Leptopilina boulardi]